MDREAGHDLHNNLIDILHFLTINVILFGFFGNFFCFKIYFSPKLRKTPISMYFCAISIFDSLMIINACFLFVYKKLDVDLSTYNGFFCKFQSYLVYTNGSISPWLMVIVSLDRFVSIAFSKRFIYMSKLKFQASVICSIVSFNYILYSFMLWNTKLERNNQANRTDENVCQQTFDQRALQWIDFFNSTIIPFIAMIILSICLISCVRMSRARVYKTGGLSSQTRRDNRLALVVISLNLIFLILNLPVVVYDLLSDYMNAITSNFFDYSVQVFYYAYYASGFYVQLVVNGEFKKEFLRLLNLRKIANSNGHSKTTEPTRTETCRN